MKMPRIDFLYRGGRFLSKIFLPTFGSMIVEGRENMPKTGAVLIASNHQSYTDPAVLIYSVDRPMWWMAKRSLFKNLFFGWFLRQVHCFGVEREGQDLAALAQATELLDRGRALLIFPEGTRYPGALGKGHDGIAYVALRTGVPIVPVAITGTDTISHVLMTPFHFRKLTAVIGKPYTLPTNQRINRALLQEMTERVMISIAELLPPEYRGVYGEAVDEIASRGDADGATP